MGGREKEKTSEDAISNDKTSCNSSQGAVNVPSINQQSCSSSHSEAHAFDKDKPGSSRSHEETNVIDQVRRNSQKTENLKEADVTQAAQFNIDNDIDNAKEDAASVEAAMLSLPTEFLGLRQEEQTGNFYYDTNKLFDSNKEAEERQHLKKAATLVNEWIQHLQ